MLVVGLERACTLLDRVPVIGWWLGCGGPFRLATRSHDLDEHWGTGVWTEVGEHRETSGHTRFPRPDDAT